MEWAKFPKVEYHLHQVEGFNNTYVTGFDITADQPGNEFENHIAAIQYAR
jgi:hypothetical protein